MPGLATTPTPKAPAPPGLPVPPERQESRLPPAESRPLLPAPHRLAARLLLIALCLLGLLLIVLFR